MLPSQYLSRCIEAMTNTCFAKRMPKHHRLYRQVMFQICMHIEGVCIREGRQASVGEVAAQKAADDITIWKGVHQMSKVPMVAQTSQVLVTRLPRLTLISSRYTYLEIDSQKNVAFRYCVSDNVVVILVRDLKTNCCRNACM